MSFLKIFFEDPEQQNVLFKLDIVGVGRYFGSKVNSMGYGFMRDGRVAARQFDKFFK